MTSKSSFGSVVASVLRVFFPRFCVKYLTLKNRSNAEEFLPGGEKEYKIILDEDAKVPTKLSYESEGMIAFHLASKTVSFVKARRWSKETRVKLLADGQSVLASDACTEEELMAAYETGNSDLLISVMRVYTPSRQKMLFFLKEKDASFMAAIATAVPAAFASLKPWEILGLHLETEVSKVSSPRWQIAKSLMKVNSSWGPKFVKEALKLSLNEVGAEELVRIFFLRSIRMDEDLSDSVKGVYEKYPMLCVALRQKSLVYKYFSDCFCELFPLILPKLSKADYSLRNFSVKESWTDCEREAFAWLKSGLCKVDSGEICSCICKEVFSLANNLGKENFEFVLNFLSNRSKRPLELDALYCLTDNKAIRANIEHNLVGLDCDVVLAWHFPFKGWQSEDDVLAALYVLAEHCKLQVERLGELTPEQQRFAEGALEACSQISAIKRGYAEKLVSIKQLHPKAELYLLKNCEANILYAYNDTYKMDHASFLFVVRSSYVDTYEKLIRDYADKWCLTKEQYHVLMQSAYRGIAPFLVNKVMSE